MAVSKQERWQVANGMYDKILHQLPNGVTRLLQTANNVQSNGDSSSAKNTGASNKKKDNTKNKPQQRKYCWTHGPCGHSIRECKNKANNHQAPATFNNMLGGSTVFLASILIESAFSQS